MRVAVIQMNSGADKAENLKASKALIDRAIDRERPDLVSLPETFTVMGGGDAGRRAAAEAIPGGAAYALLQGLAREHGVNIHGGSFFEDRGMAGSPTRRWCSIAPAPRWRATARSISSTW
jgi:deaminated glutathione amidase